MSRLTNLIELAIGSVSRNEFCRKAGISAGNLSKIMHGQRPKPDILRKIAAQSQGRVEYEALMEATGYVSGGRSRGGIPILGAAAAGSPIEAMEDIQGYISIDPSILSGGKERFALRVVGGSMDKANMPDGSVVIVERGENVADGQVAAVLVNGDATIKRVYNERTHLVLMPDSTSTAFKPQIYTEEDDVRILGKVIMSLVNIR